MTAPTDAEAELEKLRRAYSQWEDVQCIFTALDAARRERDEAIKEWNRIAEGAQDLHEDYVTACSDRDAARRERDAFHNDLRVSRELFQTECSKTERLAARVEALTAALRDLLDARFDGGLGWEKRQAAAIAEARKALSSVPEPARNITQDEVKMFDKALYASTTIVDDGSEPAPKPCTCHPDDRPPGPCPRKYANSDCVAAAKLRGAEPTQGEGPSS